MGLRNEDWRAKKVSLKEAICQEFFTFLKHLFQVQVRLISSHHRHPLNSSLEGNKPITEPHRCELAKRNPAAANFHFQMTLTNMPYPKNAFSPAKSQMGF